jgi:hypothetical protein
MKIIISPYSQKLPKETFKNNVNPSMENPKNYPYWEEFILLLKKEIPDIEVIQIGVPSEKKLEGADIIKHSLKPKELLELAQSCNAWFSVDNFINHFCSYYKIPNGFVMFGQSDPNIYGYPQNTNVLKHRKYLRPDQYGFWWDRPYIKEAFVSAEELLKLVLPVLKAS